MRLGGEVMDALHRIDTYMWIGIAFSVGWLVFDALQDWVTLGSVVVDYPDDEVS